MVRYLYCYIMMGSYNFGYNQFIIIRMIILYKHYICDVLNTLFDRCVIIISLEIVIHLFNLIRWHTGTIEKPKTRFAEKQICDAWNARRFAYKMILSLWVYMLVMIPNNNYPNTLRIIMSLSTRIPKRKNIENTFLKWFIFLLYVSDVCLFCAVGFSQFWDDVMVTTSINVVCGELVAVYPK